MAKTDKTKKSTEKMKKSTEKADKSKKTEKTPGAEKKAKASDNERPNVKMVTGIGELTIQLFEDEAKNTTANFIRLVEDGFYNGLSFHRVIAGFVAQGGCPDGNGTGGPGYCIKLEGGQPHKVGSIAMARTQHPDSAGSQFYFVLDPASCKHLDGQYTVFGEVITGKELLPQIRQGTPIKSAEVLNKRGHDYAPEKLPRR